MCNIDLSYLYSDEYLTSSFSKEKELSPKSSKTSDHNSIRTDIYWKSTSTCRRSRHILIFNKEMFKRGKNPITRRTLKVKRDSIEENLCKKVKALTNEHSPLEAHLTELQLYLNDLHMKINNDMCTNPMTEDSLVVQENIQLFSDEHFNNFQINLNN